LKYINSILFYGDFNSLIFELTKLILAHLVRRGTSRASCGTCTSWPRPRAAADHWYRKWLRYM